MSLSTHIFLGAPTKGFPVLVKAHDAKTVTLIMLQTGTEFSVDLDEYKQHRGRDFLLTPTLQDKDKAKFERQAVSPCLPFYRDQYRFAMTHADPNDPEITLFSY